MKWKCLDCGTEFEILKIKRRLEIEQELCCPVCQWKVQKQP